LAQILRIIQSAISTESSPNKTKAIFPVAENGPETTKNIDLPLRARKINIGGPRAPGGLGRLWFS
jgi:hypothetical protein